MKPPFQINAESLSLCTDIALLVGKCEGLNIALPQPKLRKQNKIKTIQATLEIEGNNLSLEQVTALLEGKRVIGSSKDILEVQNAIKAYDKLSKYNVIDVNSFLSAHAILLDKIQDDAGKFRVSNVGVLKGSTVSHVAPKYTMVLKLIDDLFSFMKKDQDVHVFVKSCVFHYEIEFIHPFTDGNGRMGRLWQTAILANSYPVFEFIPLESIIKENQVTYYDVLGRCDKKGDSTEFIIFMLKIIWQTLNDFILEAKPLTQTPELRLEAAKNQFKDSLFSRKQYLALHKDISTATASRDLLLGIKKDLLKKEGEKALTKYSFL